MLVHFHPFYKRLPEVYIEVENFKVCVCVDVCVCVCVCVGSVYVNVGVSYVVHCGRCSL